MFRKYNEPVNLLDLMISSGKFNRFIDEFREKEKHQERWEYYLHKLPPWDDMSFAEFNRKMDEEQGITSEVETTSEEQIETTINESKKIIQGFRIENGTV